MCFDSFFNRFFGRILIIIFRYSKSKNNRAHFTLSIFFLGCAGTKKSTFFFASENLPIFYDFAFFLQIFFTLYKSAEKKVDAMVPFFLVAPHY